MVVNPFSQTSPFSQTFLSSPFLCPSLLGTSKIYDDSCAESAKVGSSKAKTSLEVNISKTATVHQPPKSILKSRRAKKDKLGKKKSRGGIRFDVDVNGEVVTEVFTFEKVSSKYYSQLYMSRNEQANTQFLAKSEGETFLMDYEEMVEELDRAFLCCCRDDLSPSTEKENGETFRNWANGDVRGLEDVVSSEFHEERTLASAMILDYQVYLMETLGSDEDCDELLRTFCEHVTRRSREFATKMGAADALFA